MGVLTIAYDRGKKVGGYVLGISVDGAQPVEVKDGESRTFELQDGAHVIKLKGAGCKKTVNLQLTGDDSFVVSYDDYIGGIMIADEKMSRYTMYPRFSSMRILLAVVGLAIVAAILSVSFFGLDESTGMIIRAALVVVLLVIIAALLAMRFKAITRNSKDHH